MMSARMFRRGDTGHSGHDQADSRRGFYHVIDVIYTRVLEWALRRRAHVATIAVRVLLSVIPL
jgi:hypothetical protein